MPAPRRQTYMIGNVVALASREARKQLVDVMAEIWDVEADDHPHRQRRDLGGEHQSPHHHGRGGALRQDTAAWCRSAPPPSAPTPPGSMPVDGAGRPWQAYVFGCQVAEVEVDTVTGEVQVLGMWAAHDVGRAVNPQGVEGQIEGGIVQALGQGLMEDYKLEQRPHDHPRFRQIHPADLARRAAA